MTKEEVAELGYPWSRLLPTGEWAGLRTFMFTVGLCVGIDETSYRTRFCYEGEHWRAAHDALMTWDGLGDPPGPWIKEKGANERRNPATLKGIPIIEGTP